jgi:sugar phosphate isomerase/epimerase
LIDEVGRPQLRVLLDPANLLTPGSGAGPDAARVIDEAFDLLADDIVLVHAKDVGRRPQDGYVAAGYGTLDYRRVAAASRRVGYVGRVVMHELAAQEVDSAVAHLRAAFGVSLAVGERVG